MGKTDTAVNQLMERKEIFADFVNGTLYQGQKVVKRGTGRGACTI